MKDKNDDVLSVITVTDAKELVSENTVSCVEVSYVQAAVAVIETDMHLKDAFNNDLQSTMRNICDGN